MPLLGIELRFLGRPARSLDPMLLTLSSLLYFLMKCDLIASTICVVTFIPSSKHWLAFREYKT